MTTDVAQGAATEIPPPAPLERGIRGVIRPFGSGPEPEIPVEGVRHGRGIGWPLDSLRPDRAVGPEMHLVDGPDRVGIEPFFQLANAFATMALDPHLGHHVVSSGGLGERPRFPDGVGQRFLDEHVFAHLDRHHRDREMHVIGRRHGDRIDLVVQLQQHLAVVTVQRDVRVLLERFRCRDPVDIAQGDDVFTGHAGHVTASFAAATDASDVEFAAAHDAALAARCRGRQAG